MIELDSENDVFDANILALQDHGNASFDSQLDVFEANVAMFELQREVMMALDANIEASRALCAEFDAHTAVLEP
jgi:hypothetical protein